MSNIWFNFNSCRWISFLRCLTFSHVIFAIFVTHMYVVLCWILEYLVNDVNVSNTFVCELQFFLLLLMRTKIIIFFRCKCRCPNSVRYLAKIYYKRLLVYIKCKTNLFAYIHIIFIRRATNKAICLSQNKNQYFFLRISFYIS